MKKLLITILVVLATMGFAAAQKKMHKLSQDDKARMTPEQRMAYDNDRAYSKKSKKGKKKNESTKAKAKRARKEDRSSRRIKQPR